MQQKIIISMFFILPLAGMSQSARKINQSLQSEYTALLKTYDSLYTEDAMLFDAGEKKYREIEAAAKPIRRMLKDVGELQRRRSYLSYDLGLLEIRHSSDSLLQRECNALEARLDTIAKKLNDASKNHVLAEKEDFPSVFPGKGSVKTQNSWLTESIAKVREKNQSLQTLNTQFRLVNTNFEWSYTEFGGVNQTIDSLTLAFEKEIETLKGQKEQARVNYSANGPKGFSENYTRVFPSAFPPKVVESEWADTRAGYEGRQEWQSDAMPRPIQAPVENDRLVYDIVDEPAEFPGGISKLKEFVKTNLKYPAEAIELEIEGKCYLQFTVDSLGRILNVKVKRGVPDCPECDKEAVRMAQSMPNWTPGKNNGKPVNSLFNMPVVFKLPD